MVKIANASKIYHGGIVAYSNKSKVDLMDVEKEILAKYGAVSEKVA